MARALGDVLEAILSGVVVADAEGRVEELNSVASRLLERSREALRGRPVEELVSADHALARLARKALRDGATVSEPRQRIERRSAKNCVVDVAASPLFGDAATPSGVVLVLRDRVSDSRLEALEAARERLLGFGRIAAGLAHEIRNPLGGIRGAAELMARRARDEKTRISAELVVSESTRIEKLVDELMVFARDEELRLAPVNIHRLLDQMLALLANDPMAKGIRFERRYDPSLPEMLADGDRLTQVALNLARNALQAMAGVAGVLRIHTRVTLDRQVIPGGSSLPTLAISFEDEGCGMDEDALRHARLPLFTTRAAGTGLGLAVADYWVARHRGRLELESEKGVGTCARITLPLVETTT